MITHWLFWDCCGGKWARKSDFLVSHGNMSQHSRALIDLNSIQGTNILKVVCLSSGRQTGHSTSSDFLHHDVVISASSDLFIESNHRETSLFWVHTDVVRQILQSPSTRSWDLLQVELEAALINTQHQTLKVTKLGVVPPNTFSSCLVSTHHKNLCLSCGDHEFTKNWLVGWMMDDGWSSNLNKWRELLLFIFHFMVVNIWRTGSSTLHPMKDGRSDSLHWCFLSDLNREIKGALMSAEAWRHLHLWI